MNAFSKLEESVLWIKENNLELLFGGAVGRWNSENKLIGSCPFGAILYVNNLRISGRWNDKDLIKLLDVDAKWLHIAFFFLAL